MAGVEQAEVGVALVDFRHLLGMIRLPVVDILVPGLGDLALCMAVEEHEEENEIG